MTEDIYDIEMWKKKYPFLDRIWKSYEKFDKSVDEDGNKVIYNSQCNVIREQAQIEEGKYNDFCMKLVRNLGLFAKNPEYERPNPEGCQFLNQWVYYMTTKDKIPDNFTKEIFDRSNTIISVPNEKHVCPYYSYEEKIKEPPNIIKIFNLQIVMDDLVSILKNDNHENNCSCRNFVSECTNTYKRMNREHCSGGNKSDPNNVSTCTHLSTFSTLYELFISLDQDLKSKLPYLTDDTMNDIIHCESKNPREVLTKLSPGVPKQDSPINIGTNAVLGTMAGFTPVGNWFRSRKLIDTVGSNNIGKQAEYELFHNGPENENISFDQTKYNVAYSPV
ncbi:PIR protein [Plasmodium vivax]|uniref:VIR protein n=1 Tax=Plasmodium vivax TaxID=5855 RepID=A0A565A4I0_PLAVI|nr:PIR protein [Plasmodium vivax]